MEEKHPIKFTSGQFIVFISAQTVVLALVFLLGARFGGSLFPNFYAQLFENKAAKNSEPQKIVNQNASNRLTDTPMAENNLDEDSIPQYRVDADGNTQRVNAENEDTYKDESLTVNQRPKIQTASKHTMIRFKSSGHTRFAVEIGEYYDQLLATRRLESLKKRGYEAYLVIKDSKRADPLYAVRVGSFADRESADKYATNMSNREEIDLRVVRVN